MQKKDDTRLILAVILIAAGAIGLLRQADHFPFFTNNLFHHFVMPFRHMFSFLGNTFFSWQMILIVTGFVLLAGRRSAGWILIVAGGVFLLPELFHLSLWSFSFLIPALLIATGVILIVKASLKIN